MTRIFQDASFSGLYDDSLALVLSDMEFRRCRFDNCVLSNTRDPHRRSTVRNVRLIDCSYGDFSLGPAVVEDTTVHNLRIPSDFFTRGMAFKHVMLSGRMDDFVIAPLYAGGDGTEDEVKPINDANVEYYRGVDWALDISALECKGCEIRCIPSQLVRRDPKTQAVVRRANLSAGRWRSRNNIWNYALEAALNEGEDGAILVAGKKARDFRKQLLGIQELRAEGIADPD